MQTYIDRNNLEQIEVVKLEELFVRQMQIMQNDANYAKCRIRS